MSAIAAKHRMSSIMIAVKLTSSATAARVPPNGKMGEKRHTKKARQILNVPLMMKAGRYLAGARPTIAMPPSAFITVDAAYMTSGARDDMDKLPQSAAMMHAEPSMIDAMPERPCGMHREGAAQCRPMSLRTSEFLRSAETIPNRRK